MIEQEAREAVITLMGHAPEIWSDAELERILDSYVRAVVARVLEAVRKRVEGQGWNGMVTESYVLSDLDALKEASHV
jgi:hypothetical protein